MFAAGEFVDVTGTSKGKGFAGAIKRWNQSRGPMSHGSSYHRGTGFAGSIRREPRIQRARNLPGHMGHETITVQNLEVVKVDAERNVLLVKGSIPGPKTAL